MHDLLPLVVFPFYFPRFFRSLLLHSRTVDCLWGCFQAVDGDEEPSGEVVQAALALCKEASTLLPGKKLT